MPSKKGLRSRANSDSCLEAAGESAMMNGKTESSFMSSVWTRAVTFAGTNGTGLFCPNNKVLHTTGTGHDGNMLRYRASKFDCNAEDAKLFEYGCPTRDVHEDARDMARRLMGTKRFLKSRDERKRVEMCFTM